MAPTESTVVLVPQHNSIDTLLLLLVKRDRKALASLCGFVVLMVSICAFHYSTLRKETEELRTMFQKSGVDASSIMLKMKTLEGEKSTLEAIMAKMQTELQNANSTIEQQNQLKKECENTLLRASIAIQHENFVLNRNTQLSHAKLVNRFHTKFNDIAQQAEYEDVGMEEMVPVLLNVWSSLVYSAIQLNHWNPLRIQDKTQTNIQLNYTLATQSTADMLKKKKVSDGMIQVMKETMQLLCDMAFAAPAATLLTANVGDPFNSTYHQSRNGIPNGKVKQLVWPGYIKVDGEVQALAEVISG